MLRRAAAELRKRAEWFGSTPPWKVEPAEGGYPQRIVDDGAILYAETFDGTLGAGEAGSAEYIALVHPPVALALAAAMEAVAKALRFGREFEARVGYGELIAVARAVLREPEGGEA